MAFGLQYGLYDLSMTDSHGLWPTAMAYDLQACCLLYVIVLWPGFVSLLFLSQYHPSVCLWCRHPAAVRLLLLGEVLGSTT